MQILQLLVAGLNGCALAIACASVGLSSVVVDRLANNIQKSPTFDGRAYALAHATGRMLRTLGVWEKIAEHTQPILDIKVSDGRAGEGAAPQFLHFDHQELEEGPMGHLIEDRFLRNAFFEMIENESLITYVSNTSVDNFEINSSDVKSQLSNGQSICTRMIVGCDGRNSNVAKSAGIARRGWGYDQTALVCAVEHQMPHNGIAHQFFTPVGPLAILPLPENRCSIVWSEEAQNAEIINALDDAGYMNHLSPVFGDFLGDIKLTGKRHSYPLTLSIADKFADHRFVLVGDAAHGIHPLAGQGLNLGLKDVAALTEVLALAVRRGEDIGTSIVLERYQQWRRFDTSAMAVATDSINRLFSNDSSILRSARDIGLGAVNAMPSMRRGFMRHAAGLTGELPKLLQGIAI